jgi:hypothetical protein
MEIRVAGNQLILSGSIVGDEFARMRDVLPANQQIDTVILQDSRGGDTWAAFRMAEMFQELRFKTAVSGHCMSACVIIFLGGVERMFADGKPGGTTFLAIHTPTFQADGGVRHRPGEVHVRAQGRLFDWMSPRIRDVALLERGLSNNDPLGFVYLFDPARTTRKDGVTVFQCLGHEKRRVADCEPIPGKDALQAGFITSATILQVNPR